MKRTITKNKYVTVWTLYFIYTSKVQTYVQ